MLYPRREERMRRKENHDSLDSDLMALIGFILRAYCALLWTRNDCEDNVM